MSSRGAWWTVSLLASLGFWIVAIWFAFELLS
jgi:hypothetical protein